jgi:phosphomannomutase
MKPIRFGTEGWRAVLADDYTFQRVRVVARAAGKWFQRRSRRAPVAVGHDTRFLGDRFAAAVADELAASGIEARLCSASLPTPAVGVYVVQNGLAGSIVLTASHNPAEYNGLKVKGPEGASIPEAEAKWVEAEANRILEHEPETTAPPQEHERYDMHGQYVDTLVAMVDADRIKRARLAVVADMMHGAGGGYFNTALQQAGCAEVRGVRADPDPTFEWHHPEPIGENLGASMAMTSDPSIAVGLATDGDADRFGMMYGGEYIDVQRTIVFILYHLLKDRGYQGRVVRSINVTSMVDRLCAHFGCGVEEKSVGFKNIAPEMVSSTDVVLGVEESGGFGIKGHIPDRDGTLAALMACEALAWQGKPLPEILSDIFAVVGGRRHFGRIDLTITAEQHAEVTRRLPALQPKSVAGQGVVDVNRLDGAKCIREDGTWLLLRLSGTEPLVRIYAEAMSERDTQALLSSGRDLVMAMTGSTR